MKPSKEKRNKKNPARDKAKKVASKATEGKAKNPKQRKAQKVASKATEGKSAGVSPVVASKATEDKSAGVSQKEPSTHGGFYFNVTDHIRTAAKAIEKELIKIYRTESNEPHWPWSAETMSQIVSLTFLNGRSADKFINGLEVLNTTIATHFSSDEDYLLRHTFHFGPNATTARHLLTFMHLKMFTSNPNRTTAYPFGPDLISEIARSTRKQLTASTDTASCFIFLTQIFPTPLVQLIKSISITQLDIDRISPELKELIDAYRTAYTGNQIKTFEAVSVATEQAGILGSAVTLLLDLLNLIQSDLSETKTRCVVIKTHANGGIETKVDGIVVASRRVPERALVALALLSPKTFSLDEFRDLYSGDTSGDSSKRFLDAMDDIEKAIGGPRLCINCGTALRKTNGVIFKVTVPEETLKAFLFDNYPAEIRKKLSPAAPKDSPVPR